MSRIRSFRLAAILLPVILFIGFGGIFSLYGQLSHISEMDVLDSYEQTVSQITENINSQMNSVEKTLQMIAYDSRLVDSLSRSAEEDTLAEQLLEIKDLRELVYTSQANRNLRQIRLYLPDRKMLSREKINFFKHSDAIFTPEFPAITTANGLHCWFGSHQVKTKYFNEQCITLGSLIRFSFSSESENWALLLLDLSEEQMNANLKTMRLPCDDARILVVDREGTPMFGTGEPAIALDVLKSSDGIAGNGFCSSDRSIAYICLPLKNAEWFVVFYTPTYSLLSSHGSVHRTLTLLLFGLTLLLIAISAFAFLILYTVRVNGYIRKLSDSLQHSDSSEKRRTPMPHILFNLDKDITGLLKTNEQLTEANYAAELRERDVTLQALQAQINPHFLYNTLDAINWMAIRAHAVEASEAISTLADYFRLSLNQGRTVVTLTEDVEIAKKYLAICAYRYDYSYQVIWDISKNARDCQLPKLTLQPLIENALFHGIYKRSTKLNGLITVRATYSDTTLLLTVTDNGPGLTDEAHAGTGFGLRNVRERLNLYCPGQNTLTIENGKSGGAVVTLTCTAGR